MISGLFCKNLKNNSKKIVKNTTILCGVENISDYVKKHFNLRA